jgi:ATP-binding cassette, subfamily C (CFTR/MRP), member 1
VGASISWDPAPSGPGDDTLTGLDLDVARGKLTMVVGSVASGRSTVLRSILGETRLTKGMISMDPELRGRPLSYAAQQAWLDTATIRENILEGLPFDAERYGRVIEACALTRDLGLMKAGDATLIAEGGAGVSGGQKQRIALARAVYPDNGLYELDDPLSALDAEVAQWVFERVLGPRGMLADKTRVLVTHQVQFAANADYVYVMHECRVIHRGTPAGEVPGWLSPRLTMPCRFLRARSTTAKVSVSAGVFRMCNPVDSHASNR